MRFLRAVVKGNFRPRGWIAPARNVGTHGHFWPIAPGFIDFKEGD
jgi:hypothetical protein